MTNSLIIIDPGHGGLDYSGEYLTRGKRSEFIINGESKLCYEGVLNRAVAHMLNFRLSHQGIKSVVICGNEDMPLAIRSRAANEAAKDRKSFLISIHHNAFIKREATGPEIFAYNGAAPISHDIAQMAGSTYLSHFGHTVPGRKLRVSGDLHRGELATYKKRDFHMLRETSMPSVLMEFGFMTNRSDFEYITSLEGIRDQVRYLEHVCENVYHNYL